MIPFAKPSQDKNLNYWRATTDFSHEKFVQRPFFFYHLETGKDADGNRRDDLLERAGTVLDDSIEITPHGVRGRVELNGSLTAQEIVRMVEKGIAAGSTGCFPHHCRARWDGFITRWWWSELSAAHKDHTFARDGLTQIEFVRSVFPVLKPGGERIVLQMEPTTETPAAANDGAVMALLTQIATGQRDMSTRLTALEERETPPARSLPAGGDNPAAPPPAPPANIQVSSRWDSSKALPMLMLWNLRRQHGDESKMQIFDAAFMRALFEKVSHLDQHWHERGAHDRELMIPRVGEYAIPSMRAFDDEAKALWRTRLPNLRADEAMQTDLTNFGAEFLVTLLNSMVHYQTEMATKVASLFPSFMMPSNPFNWPTVTGGPTVRAVKQIENRSQFSVPTSPIPDSKIGTDKVIFTAGGFGALTLGSEELFEDSFVSLMDVWTTQYIREFAKADDEIIISGDESATATNISHYGTDPTGTDYDKITAFDGLRHIAFDNSDTAAYATIDDLIPITLGALMGPRGRLGMNIADLAIICDPGVGYKIAALESYESLNDVGARASLLTGQVGAVRGVPVIVSDELENTNASGQIEDSHDGTKGSLLLVHRPTIMRGIRRDMTLKVSAEIPGVEGRVMWTTARKELKALEAGSVAYGYNTTI